MAADLPLIVIVGPTASGKTGLAIQLAKDFGGEIISADSRAIYRDLDIGTAKPSLSEQQGIPHWGINLVNPGERFTAVDFKEYAEGKIQDIRARGHVPFLVGGTGLYIDAVVYDFQFPNIGEDLERRQVFEKMTIAELHEYCNNNNIRLPENKMNKRYVVNSILRNGRALERRQEPRDDCIVVGISTEKEILKQRITDRAEVIFNSEVVVEAKHAAARYGWDNEAMTGNVYPLIHKLVKGELSFDDAKEKFRVLDWRLAKRQLTWLRRDEHIKWFSLDDAHTYLTRFLEPLNNS